MEKPRCEDGHRWGCAKPRGLLGERIEITLLNPLQLAEIAKDPGNAEKVCPHGAIRCVKCRTYLNSSERERGRISRPTITLLASRLRRQPRYRS